ncbi:hypothetical protein LTS18_006910 [Coniosporium uncinatum]|uniref:Uncharacterized protein n=1 Tax=Coniosporium uncinatum TaxID=93489 RepID=A0ACC3DX70_9PEZI|nr:hypothetical protein LTS18_006910 [Coniosporium uncinatum]
MESLTFSLQALLVRHESYMASAEAERSHLSASIAELESEKKSLEARNTSLIEENRSLLDQLEDLNGALGRSEASVESLAATLLDTQREVQRLTVLAGRTEDLERQMEWLEGEYESLEGSLEDKDEVEKTAVQRWRNAEQVIAGLYDQVERIEREAREERERHEEVVGRMERTRAVERELDSAAGRLKGAAAFKTVAEGNGPSVVSHFVKDILQDNANLQLGIAELRDMLQNANEEVERLREQVVFHQPVDVREDEVTTPNLQRELQKEFGLDLPQTQPQPQPAAVHVHHHYHAPETTVKPKRPAERRVKRKRNVVSPGVFTSSSSRTPSSNSAVTPSYALASATLSQTSASIPQQSQPHRWSMQSNQSYLSGSSSPYPNSNRTSSVFDRVCSDAGMESSRPTSPESSGPVSPEMAPLSRKEMQKAFGRNSSLPNSLPQADSRRDSGNMQLSNYIPEEDIAEMDLTASQQTIIPQEPEDSPVPDTESQNIHDINAPDALQRSTDDAALNTTTISADIYRPSLHRRAASHESLLSVSGMDIHTLKSRPSQVLVVGGGLSSRFAALAATSASATVSAATATAARPTSGLRRGDSKTVLASVAGGQRCSSDGSATGLAQTQAPVKKKGSEGSLGGWVGGWVRGKWGYAPPPSPSPSPSPSAARISRASCSSRPPARPPALARQSSSSSTASPSTSTAQRAKRPTLVSASTSASTTVTIITEEEADDGGGEVNDNDFDPTPPPQAKESKKRPMGLPSPPLFLPSSKPPKPLHAKKDDDGDDKPSRILDAEATPVPQVMQAPRLRTPGINQKGWVLGFGPEPPTPARVEVDVEGRGVDWEGLREGLLEG